MIRKLSFLFALLWLLFFSDNGKATTSQTTGLPPLPPNCGGWGLPIHYPVCCVYGYVILDGKPVTGAQVFLDAGAMTKTIQTTVGSDGGRPFFRFSLSGSDQNQEVEIGTPVTLTASYAGISQTVQFITHEGSQQIDIVLPTPYADSIWQPGSISARRDHAMTYDAARQELVLFGGSTIRNDHLAETWTWKNGAWQLQSPTRSPTARDGHSLVYDSTAQKVMLFGGQSFDGEYFQDLWVWSGSQWAILPTATIPSARAYHAMAYDPNRQRIVLFGGGNSGGGLNDTWEWDGASWNEMKPPLSPTKRIRHSMVYDENSQRVLLFGGQADVDHPEKKFNDLWAWDGSNWQLITPASQPPPLAGHRIAYDTAHHKTILFGGEDANGNLNESTWEFAENEWKLHMSDPSPRARSKHAMVYDPGIQKIVLFGGVTTSAFQWLDLADTWLWDGNNWQQSSQQMPFLRWRDVAFAPELNGDFISFGGLNGNSLTGVPQDRTYRWNQREWQQLTPATLPLARYGHQLVRNQDGSKLLMFGGLGDVDFYLDDSWVWDGSNWLQSQPLEKPSPRAWYSLAYDQHRGVWVLFGGETEHGVENDMWEFNGEIWLQRSADLKPAARKNATLTYDPIRKRLILFGGRNADTFFDDLWEWYDSQWHNVTSDVHPSARSDHGATFNPVENSVVIAGGVGPLGELTDTWLWNGEGWRAKMPVSPLPSAHSLRLAFDSRNQQIVALLEHIGGNLAGEGLWTLSPFHYDTLPVATIQWMNKSHGRQGLDTFEMSGGGADGDDTNEIIAFRWTHNQQIIGTESHLSLPLTDLPLGLQTIVYAVQDDEGNWSAPLTTDVWVDPQEPGKPGESWTLLIYAIGDNDLALAMNGTTPGKESLLYRLQKAGAQQNVTVGVLFDGDGGDDTARYVLKSNGDWLAEKLPEADMGKMETLRDFVHWGTNALSSTHTILALVDHANGIVGFGRDEHGESVTNTFSFLSPIEIQTAIQLGMADNVRKLDIVFFDGCSFGTIETLSTVANLTNYVIASPNTSWGFYDYAIYRSLAGSALNAERLAIEIANKYAERARGKSLPYTISVYDMGHYAEMVSAVDELGNALSTYITSSDTATRTAQIYQLRNNVIQKYDSGGLFINQIDVSDHYVDLLDMAKTLSQAITQTDIHLASQHLDSVFMTFVMNEDLGASGEFTYQGKNLRMDIKTDIGGLGIFFPKTFSSTPNSSSEYYGLDELFQVTPEWGWKKFLLGGTNSLPICLPDDSCSTPEEDVLLSPLFEEEPSTNQQNVFLPLIVH